MSATTVAQYRPGLVHFHNSDTRFCGSRDAPRRFTFDPNEVNCAGCQARDTFEITDSGRAAIAKTGRGKA